MSKEVIKQLDLIKDGILDLKTDVLKALLSGKAGDLLAEIESLARSVDELASKIQEESKDD